MQCFMKKQDNLLVVVENGEATLISITVTVVSSTHCPPFCYSFVSYISVFLLSHPVQLTSPSSLVCSLCYPVGVIRLNIATTSARRLIKILLCSCLEGIAQ